MSRLWQRILYLLGALGSPALGLAVDYRLAGDRTQDMGGFILLGLALGAFCTWNVFARSWSRAIALLVYVPTASVLLFIAGAGLACTRGGCL